MVFVTLPWADPGVVSCSSSRPHSSGSLNFTGKSTAKPGSCIDMACRLGVSSALALVLGFPWAAAAVVPPPAIPLVVTPITINNSPGHQVDPHVDGDIASYSDFAVAAQIRYYDFRTGQDVAIPAAGYLDQLSNVNAGRIVFIRIFSEGSEAVMLFDTTSNSTPVEVNPVADPVRTRVAIGGDTIAYVDHALSIDQSGEIVVYDLTTGAVTQLTTDTDIDQAPAVSPDGNVVVWERCPSTSLSFCDVNMAIKSGPAWMVSQVAAGPAPEIFPGASNQNVIWTAHNGTDYDIYWRAVTGGATQQIELPGDQVHASIAGNVIAFEGLSNGGTDIFIYDIAFGQLYQLTNTPVFHESLNDLAVLPGNQYRVVWQANDGSEHLSDIHAATFALMAPDISVSPLSYNFGDVITGSASSALFTIFNSGDFNLEVSNIGLQAGSSSDYTTTGVPTLPATITPGNSVDIELSFTPSVVGIASAVLEVASNDLDEPVVQVSLSGAGVQVDIPPSEQISNILMFFDDSVTTGTLTGSGQGNSARNRLNALRNMIEAASDLIDQGMLDAARQQLLDAYAKCDGQPNPPDFVSGPAAAQLAALILDLINSLNSP